MRFTPARPRRIPAFRRRLYNHHRGCHRRSRRRSLAIIGLRGQHLAWQERGLLMAREASQPRAPGLSRRAAPSPTSSISSPAERVGDDERHRPGDHGHPNSVRGAGAPPRTPRRDRSPLRVCSRPHYADDVRAVRLTPRPRHIVTPHCHALLIKGGSLGTRPRSAGKLNANA